MGIIELLEAKRNGLGETKRDFSKRFNLDAGSYSKMTTKKLRFPKNRIPDAATLLGVSEQELNGLGGVSPRGERCLSAEDLLYLAKIVKAVQKSLPISLLLRHLDCK